MECLKLTVFYLHLPYFCQLPWSKLSDLKGKLSVHLGRSVSIPSAKFTSKIVLENMSLDNTTD